MSNMNLGRVMVLGSRGMVGSACIRELQKHSGVSEIIPVCRDQVDLTDQVATFQYIASELPDWVIVAAAKVGGIYANNTYPADFIYQNLAIQNNAIEGAFRAGVENLIFLGSSCIYPRHCPQPIKEEYLLTGSLELTNLPYAVAKIAGIKLCEAYNRQLGTDFRSLMPTNLYGPGDNYHPTESHVLPALLSRFHDAKLNGLDSVVVWGTGQVRREFMHVYDLASAVCHVMSVPKAVYEQQVDENCSHINIGCGQDIKISELVDMLVEVVDFRGEIIFDHSYPDGVSRKKLDVSKIRILGWETKISLRDGIKEIYADFKNI